jgi:hypothetical protein
MLMHSSARTTPPSRRARSPTWPRPRALATPEMPVFILEEDGVKIPVDEYGREPETPAETTEAPAPAAEGRAEEDRGPQALNDHAVPHPRRAAL